MEPPSKAEAFRALHEGAAVPDPEPVGRGSARVLEALGFKALATTSSGFAFTLGRLDGVATLDEVVAPRAPRRGDGPAGLGRSRERLRRRARGAAARDRAASPRPARSAARSRTTTPTASSTSADRAVERIAAAVEAARGLGFPFTLTARAENHIRGNPDLDDTIARLQAYEAAGADVLYAPGLAPSRRSARSATRCRSR